MFHHHRFCGALGVAASLLISLPARAHVTLEPGEAAAGASVRIVLKVNHGCDGAGTTGLKVSIPDGLTGVRPMPKPGWSLAVERGGRPGPAALLWSGGEVPDAFYDEFVLVGRIDPKAEAGRALAFPVEQVCGATTVRWDDPAEGGRHPAPAVRVAASREAGGATVRAGDLTIAQPWLRATPGGATVAGGFVRVANGGREDDRLVGASLEAATAGEVHETTSSGGVSRMMPVAGGLAVRPGEAVELKPGGYHLMFTGLTRPLAAGESVAGTLRFERAGTVPVLFRVEPAGAPRPSESAEHHH